MGKWIAYCSCESGGAMTNWTIFLLHFVAGIFYIKSGVRMEESVDVIGNKVLMELIIAITCTTTAAWL